MYTLGLLFFATLFNTDLAQVEPGYQPMVAFTCGYPAMYLTESGWVKDDDFDCVDDLEDVLYFCQKAFPNLDVRNVVESSQQRVIENWCGFDEMHCNNRFTVRPYRCLVGPFQSDALLVPAGCIFDHVHKSQMCKSFAEWNATAMESCDLKNYYAQSFAVLQPCKGYVGHFDGVEFVCCPKGLDPVPVPALPQSDEPQPVMSSDSSSIFYNYMHNDELPSLLGEEHDQYLAAKADLQRLHQDTDDDKTDKLQLDTRHQQRVQSILDKQKQDALVAYQQAVAKQIMETIYNTLKQYLRIEQKDRQHITNRYHHLFLTDPQQLAVEKHTMANRLRTISRNIVQAVELLDQLPFGETLRNMIDDYLTTYSQLDRSSTLILNDDEDDVKPIETTNVQGQPVFDDSSDYDDDDYWEKRPKDEMDKIFVDDGYYVDDNFDMPVSESKQEVEEDKKWKDDYSYDVSKQRFEWPDSEDSDEVEDKKKKDYENSYFYDNLPKFEQRDHLSESQLDQDEVQPLMKPVHKRHDMSAGLVVMTVGGCAVLIGLIVASAFMIRRRAQQGPGFSSVSQSVPPEDVHITSMQMTGYENPTYKFFEDKGSCNA